MSDISIQTNVSNLSCTMFNMNREVSRSSFDFDGEMSEAGNIENMPYDKMENRGVSEECDRFIEKEDIPRDLQDTASTRSDRECRHKESRDKVDSDSESRISNESQAVEAERDVDSSSEENPDELKNNDKSNEDVVTGQEESAEKDGFIPFDILRPEIEYTLLSEKIQSQIDLSNVAYKLVNATDNENGIIESIDWKAAQSNINNEIAATIKDESIERLLPELPLDEGIRAAKITEDKRTDILNLLNSQGGKSENDVLNANSLGAGNGTNQQKLQYADAESIKSELSAKYKNEDVTENSKILSESSIKNTKEFQNAFRSITGDSTVEKAEIQGLQVSSEQIKGRGESYFGDSNTSGIDNVVSQSSQELIPEQNVNSAGNIRTDNLSRQSALDDINADIGKQILESIRSSFSGEEGSKQITVRLNPPELGQVHIKFQDQNTELTGLLEVSKAQTRAEIEQVLPQIIRNLSDSGIDIKRIDVVLTSDGYPEQETSADQSFFGDGQQGHNSDESGIFGNNHIAGVHEWLAHSINYGDYPGGQASSAGDNSINVLI